MADIALQIDIAADPADVYTALTTTDGVAGWWTTRNETSSTVGEINRYYFPDAPFSWDMRIDAAEPGSLVSWHCIGGPPPWIGTDIRWMIRAKPEGGSLVVFDHTGFAGIDETFRIVTLGWAEMVLRLRDYLESGKPVPYFTH